MRVVRFDLTAVEMKGWARCCAVRDQLHRLFQRDFGDGMRSHTRTYGPEVDLSDQLAGLPSVR